MMISSLDAGQCISLESISNKEQRALLESIAKALPLEYDANHKLWYKPESIPSISQHILNTLLTNKNIKQPTTLSMSETFASQQAPLAYISLLASYPTLNAEFPPLLSVLLTGNAIDIENIENEALKEGLEKLFRCLNLANTDEGYCLPEDGKRPVVREALLFFQSMLEHMPTPPQPPTPAAAAAVTSYTKPTKTERKAAKAERRADRAERRAHRAAKEDESDDDNNRNYNSNGSNSDSSSYSRNNSDQEDGRGSKKKRKRSSKDAHHPDDDEGVRQQV
jgi:hypothetical protein